MKDKILPLRIGVGAIVLNSKNKVFVGKRIDNPIDKWQMPQGGVNKNENYLIAMKRELLEETSIKSIKVLEEFDEWLEYELPNRLLGIIWKGKFRGQKQKWFVTRFIGNDNEINVNTKDPEFLEWKWIEIDELENVVVDFKKGVYEKILIKLKKFIN
jgi:putative (di)nucleoside polyphosphate hydrolase|tara:strand:- start:793 stop:1263 length:471 start_codon:yes stop_codon:yes gene_type:complete